MKNRIKYILTLILLLHFWNTEAQQTIEVQLNDDIQLEADSYRGSIQWQISNDNQQWENIDAGNISPFIVTVLVLPSYYRAKIIEDNCAPHYSEVITIVSDEVLRWSNSNTWGNNGKPKDGDEITIPLGTHILLDENTPTLSGLIIDGTLEFDRKDIELTTEWIIVNGLLEIGTELEPFEQKAIVTLTDVDTEASAMGDMGTRGIMAMNGILELHGAVPNVVWTKINANAMAGSTSLELMESVDWNVGDEVVIAPTDFYEAGVSNQSVTQHALLTDISNLSITIAEELNAHRWGSLQYATNTGMSLTPTDMVTPPVQDTQTNKTPLILDERAEIGNMTRNIVIQAPDDDLWKNEGFGVHTMIMPNATAHIEGVEFKRAGQRGRLRRYPFHWHMLSYLETETLEDATGQYFNNNTINSSANRGIVIHGTNGVSVMDNIVYDIRGHGIFTEDAVERRNIIDGNLVLHIRNPAWGSELKQHEVGEHGSSGFWISNPDNTVANNTAADSGTFGFWLSFPEQPWGENIGVVHPEDGLLLRPNRLLFGVFDNNTAHSNLKRGIMLDDVEIDNLGNTSGSQYYSTTNGREPQWPFETLRRFSLSRYITYKNGHNGIWDRSTWVDNFEVVSADNCGRFFAGAGAGGVIERSLVVGNSLNQGMNDTDREQLGATDFYADQQGSEPTAFATYHSTFDIKDNIIIGFPLVDNVRSGAFATDDYYIRPVEKGQYRNTGNLLVNSHPGFKMKATYSYYTLASALWDPNGIWGPADNYIVYDDLFLTYGKQKTIIEPGTGSGGVSVAGPFYGFEGFVLHGVGYDAPQNQPFKDLMGIHVSRLDQSFNEVATWEVLPAIAGQALDHMRDFTTSPDGIYELTFPSNNLPTDFQVNVENMLESSDTQVLAVQYDGSLNPTVYMQIYQFFEAYQEVGSRQEVIDSDGATWWQDKPANFIWVKLRGGIWQFWTNDPNTAVPTNDDFLYETTILKIEPN